MQLFGLTIDNHTFAQGSMWVVNCIYFLGVIPQIVMNWKTKSTAGLSRIMLYGYVLAYIFQITYTYCLDMPRSYKVMLPISLCAVLVIVAQRLYYATHLDRRSAIKKYAGILLIALLLALLGHRYPLIVGMYAGWIAMIIWSVYMLPQGLKMHANKSVVGFSFGYATIMTLGGLLESTSAWLLSDGGVTYWPLIFNGFRGLLGYLMFCVEFLLYGKKNN